MTTLYRKVKIKFNQNWSRSQTGIRFDESRNCRSSFTVSWGGGGLYGSQAGPLSGQHGKRDHAVLLFS